MKFLEFFSLINRNFKRFGLGVASVFNCIFLLPVYFVGVGITSLFIRLSKKEVLALKKSNEKSYWKEYNLKKQKKEDYKHMF